MEETWLNKRILRRGMNFAQNIYEGARQLPPPRLPGDLSGSPEAALGSLWLLPPSALRPALAAKSEEERGGCYVVFLARDLWQFRIWSGKGGRRHTTCSSRRRKRERSPEGLPTPASENNLNANDNNDVHLSLNNTSVFIFFSSVFEWRRNFGKI